jgi:hypothetical protein
MDAKKLNRPYGISQQFPNEAEADFDNVRRKEGWEGILPSN